MADYPYMNKEFERVRRSWRRTRTLEGFTGWILEILGIFTVAVLANALFDLHAITRAGILAGAALLAVYFFLRQVVAPFTRRIADHQIALFVEEGNEHFEGALMAAAEFGSREAATPAERDIIQAIVDSAVERTGKFNVRVAVKPERLRKYAVAVVVLLGVYGVAALVQPRAMKESILTTVNPLYVRPQQTASVLQRFARGLTPEDRPLQIALTRNGQPLPPVTALRRGSRFDVEAALNRDPMEGEKPVIFNVRPASAAGAAWSTLPMASVEKVYGYRVELPDVNEDVEFTVSAGKVASASYRVQVYDPLAVEKYVVATRPPAYLNLPETESLQPSSVVSAYVGSRVTLKVTANNALASGELAWENGVAQAGQVGSADARVVTAAFDITNSTSFVLTLRDKFGQELRISPPFVVEAKQDAPPTLTLKQPKYDVSMHPLGEMRVVADAGDDIALDGVDIVFVNGADLTGTVHRLACSLAPRSAAVAATNAASRALTEATATGTLALESMDGGAKVGDMFTFYVEAKDRKGNRTTTDVYFLFVQPYEDWGFWAVASGGMRQGAATHGGGGKVYYDPLAKFVAAVWHLRSERERMDPEEYRKACEDLGLKIGKAVEAGKWKVKGKAP